MKRPRDILVSPLLISLLAATFCLWCGFGNDINFCVTAGCSLYQDFTPGGISLWWIGAAVFTILAVPALLGLAGAGRALSGLALLGDIGLLLLMALTAPCINCLVAAVFFALLYQRFNSALRQGGGRSLSSRSPSLLLWIWFLMFAVNVGAVGRSQIGLWPILGDEEARVRIFFSPSCPKCREGVDILSGNVDVAFYPLAEEDRDVYRVAHMVGLLDTGMNIADALSRSLDVAPPQGMGAYSPDMLLTRFRMLCNKAHVFMAGGSVIPFFEYHGLPAMLTRRQGTAARDRTSPATPTPPPGRSPSPEADKPGHSEDISLPAISGQDPILPLEPQIAGQCGANTPCP